MRILIISTLFLYINCSVPHHKLDSNHKKKTTQDCILLQKRVDLSHKNFGDQKRLYQDFISSNNSIDILIKKHLRSSSYYRLYQNNNLEYVLSKYTDKSTEFTKIVLEQSISIPNSVGEYAFICNRGSSDLGHSIYIFKVQGKLSGKIWIENGDFHNLPDSELNLNKVKGLLSSIEKNM